MIAFSCPHCGKAFRVDVRLAGRRARCKRCGVLTTIPAPKKLSAADAPVPAPAPIAAPQRSISRRKPKLIDRHGRFAIVIGLGLACFALLVPWAGFVVHVLMTVVHELGHVATAWLFGSPALPSFDLTYGGGFSHILARQPIVIILVYAAFASLAYRMRDDRTALITVLAVIVLYSAVVFSSLRELLVIAMGHGSELLFAGLFLFRAFSGSQIVRSQERPLYAFLGLYIVMDRARFAYRLMTSHEHRESYGNAKGGGHWMDFSRIANEHLHVRLEVVAGLFLLACAITPMAAFLFYCYQRRRN
jgi:predicted Zn finger-like uncharacterized protein